MTVEDVFMEGNMAQQVVIKHNRYGIELVLDNQISFEELLEVIVEKFQSASHFFRDKKMAVSFKGRKLSEKESNDLIE